MEVQLSTVSDGIWTKVNRRALLANNSEVSTISRDLAAALNIDFSDEIPVADIVFSGGSGIFHLANKLLFVECDGERFDPFIPLINHENAFYDIIIGKDAPGFMVMLIKMFDDLGPDIMPSPGPGYEPNVHFMGHNVSIIGEANKAKKTVHLNKKLESYKSSINKISPALGSDGNKLEEGKITEMAERNGYHFAGRDIGTNMIAFEKETTRLNFWLSTGTVGSYLQHPKNPRKKRTQLFRRDVDHKGALEIIKNPRVHTGKGYTKAGTKRQRVEER